MPSLAAPQHELGHGPKKEATYTTGDWINMKMNGATNLPGPSPVCVRTHACMHQHILHTCASIACR